MRVLVVEDERKVAEALRHGLQGAGYDVVVEHTGDGAFFRGTTESFDVILLDLTLPGRDGLEVLTAFRKLGIGGSVNVRTADPTPAPQFGFDFTGGQFGTAKGVAKASGPVGQWGGYYVSAAKERNTGFYESKTGDFLIDKWALFGKLTFTPDSKSFGFVTLNRVLSDDSTPTNEPFIDGRLLHDIDPNFDRLTSFNIPGPNSRSTHTRSSMPPCRGLRAVATAFRFR